MANRNQFGLEADAAGGQARAEGCAVCEAMLPEAVDGALSEAEQRAFDRHVAGCAECARELAEAQRGVAWLSMLRSEAPQPPVGMLERILAETTGVAVNPPMHDEAVQEWGTRHSATPPMRSATPAGKDRPLGTPVTAHEWGTRSAPVVAHERGTRLLAAIPVRQPAQVPAWALSSVWRRAMGAFRVEDARASLQPRLAMTAAMAFFSIALTLNLTGVRLSDLRAQDFTPSGVRRAVVDGCASAERAFQNNRVVYQVESRVSELRSDEAPAAGRDAAEDQGADDRGAGLSQ